MKQNTRFAQEDSVSLGTEDVTYDEKERAKKTLEAVSNKRNLEVNGM